MTIGTQLAIAIDRASNQTQARILTAYEQTLGGSMVINIKCESDESCYSQRVQTINVVREDEQYWHAVPLTNPACPVLMYPKFAWKQTVSCS